MLRLYDSALGARRRRRADVPPAASRCTSADRPSTSPRTSATAASRSPGTCCAGGVSFDGLDVDHVSNVTDIDDNIIARARREGRTEAEVAAQYEAQWWAAMDALEVLRARPRRPTRPPSSTEMIEMIGERCSRPATPTGSTTASTSTPRRSPSYGLLAGQPLDSLRAGARVEAERPEALAARLRPVEGGQARRARPGRRRSAQGRPGWHTECVVMSLALLGEHFDLHCGRPGPQVPAPRERARTGRRARSRLRAPLGAQRLGRGRGREDVEVARTTSPRSRTCLTRADARAYRLLLLRAHYRAPIEVTTETIADAERALERLDAVATAVRARPPSRRHGAGAPIRPRARRATADVVARSRRRGRRPATRRRRSRCSSTSPRGRTRWPTPATLDAGARRSPRCSSCSPRLRRASSLRGRGRVARRALRRRSRRLATRRGRGGDFAEADRLRDELVTLGFVVEDTASGTRIRPRS